MVELRDATPEDAPEVAGVHIRAWQAAYRGLFPDEFLEGLRVEDRAARYSFGSSVLHAPRTILALEDGAISGFATISRSRDADAPHAGELQGLYVDPSRWGMGIGRLLMVQACAGLRAKGFVEAILWVLVGNEQAARFYLADGWRRDGSRRREDPWGVTAEVLRYRRSLT